MTSEVQLINDGNGIAIIGDPKAVDLFVQANDLPWRTLAITRVIKGLGAAGNIAEAGSTISAKAGRWVKLTEKSAQALKQSTTMKGSEPGVYRAILTGDKGKITGILEIVKTPTTLLTNPALLSGVGGLMAQESMRQSMEEITRYLKSIDEKCDDILRAQNDSVLSAMIGVGKTLDEALEIKDQVGSVSEVTWSKIQGASQILRSTEAYALKQLETLAQKVHQKLKVGELADATTQVNEKVQEWLVVIARCFQLQDTLALLELDRVIEIAIDETDDHRRGLAIARERRASEMSQVVTEILDRITWAATKADQKTLIHPNISKRTVRNAEGTASKLGSFCATLELDAELGNITGRSWIQAFTDTRDKAIDTGKTHVDSAKRVGAEGAEAAKRLGLDSVDSARRLGAEGTEVAKRLGAEGKEAAKKASGKVFGSLAGARDLLNSKNPAKEAPEDQ